MRQTKTIKGVDQREVLIVASPADEVINWEESGITSQEYADDPAPIQSLKFTGTPTLYHIRPLWEDEEGKCWEDAAVEGGQESSIIAYYYARMSRSCVRIENLADQNGDPYTVQALVLADGKRTRLPSAALGTLDVADVVAVMKMAVQAHVLRLTAEQKKRSESESAASEPAISRPSRVKGAKRTSTRKRRG